MSHRTLVSCIKPILLGGLIVGSTPIKTKDEQSEISTSTGTRIAKKSVTLALPVAAYTRMEILRSGHSNAADFIRNLPINSFGSLRPQSGNSVQGDANVSLRGLGGSRTLVLIDGRRMLKSPCSSSSPNLSLLPLGPLNGLKFYQRVHQLFKGPMR